MKNILKSKLVGNTAIYALANVLNGVIPFLLLPVLTRVFTPEEYGLVTLISAVIAIISAFTGLSVHGAVSVKYFDKEIDHPKFVGASLMVLAGSTCLVLVFLLVAGGELSEWIHLPKQWLIIAAIASAAQFVINIRLTMWQVQDQAMRYGFFQVTQTFFNLSLSLALVFWMMMGWEGRAWGIVAAAVIFAGFAMITLHKEKLVDWQGDKKYAKSAIYFGVPLIPHVVGGLMMAISDRIVLNSLLDLKSVGNYSVGIQMAVAIGVLADAVSRSYGPYLLKTLANKSVEKEGLIVRNTYIIFIFFFLSALIYSFLLPWIYLIFVGKSFHESLEIARIASFGYAFQGMYYAISNFLFYREKTGRLSMLTFGCGILNVGMTYWFVNLAGMVGAVWSFLLLQIIFFLGAWFLAQRVHPMPWFKNTF
ncbi:oligosaccharide flippase family protein [Methylotenera sp.]|uniref:oligosaccharide flippase family protein n=1 Tax=Methylotenera sp. TaxID=2051956 RepID=UPI00273248E0|nr:oligosaccharide flippase family protein [Methylotenera sp.]MDP3776396.1 oligosaccharide flippase family protein [Methylotenera sp.]